jgi:uncharacterized membrane protein (UPF0127 family)
MLNENPERTGWVLKVKRSNRKLWRGLLLILAGAGLVGWSLSREAPRIVVGGDTIRVTVADEESEQVQGLSGRAGLASDAGMLFVYQQPSRPGFWMKDMRFDIDIIWIGEPEGQPKIMAVLPYLTPQTYPQVFAPPEDIAPVRYVLEVPAGTVDRLDWQIGDLVQIKL